VIQRNIDRHTPVHILSCQIYQAKRTVRRSLFQFPSDLYTIYTFLSTPSLATDFRLLSAIRPAFSSSCFRYFGIPTKALTKERIRSSFSTAVPSAN
jgi:hypothetical protein